MPTGKPRRQRGFSYFAVLFLLALMGTALAAAGQLWSGSAQRERERQLLWVGTQYAQALHSYYLRSPGQAQYPRELEELLQDRRVLQVQRHLRTLYPDPITGSTQWGLVRALDGGIVGVYSLSPARPRKRDGFAEAWRDFAEAQHYTDWQFLAERIAPGTVDTPPVQWQGGGL